MSQSLIPYSGFSAEILKYFYSTDLLFKNDNEEFLNLYCFISKVDPWDNELSPPLPEDSDYYLKTVYSNLIAIKQINSNNISPVVKRIDWKSGVTYNKYSSNMISDINYYVRNSYDQVFKCLSNGTSNTHVNGVASTEQPIIDYTTNFTENIIYTGDGYKWKYLYTIDAGAKLKFFDENWMPVPILTHRKSLASNSIKAGEVSVINVYSAGSSYSNDNGSNTTNYIEIVGDGYGATAKGIISGNVVTEILVTNGGSNYTYATANIVPKFGYSGNGAILTPEISPIGGHGYNLLTELGCKTVIVSAEFNGSETGILPTDIDYRQIGLLANPEITIGSATVFANSSIYKASHNVTVSAGSGYYEQDEIVYQGTADNQTYSGRVLNFDATNNILYLINTHGTVSLYKPLYGSNSNAIRILIQEVVEQIVPFSGNILYIENRTKVQRTSTGLEQFRLTLNY